ncbi:hypothetical protein CDAR_236261 [Caerostris darwini]|uniref:Uncharacterized protein n=1 Tax=Caerostris darwini TaxID=1538125 RepID=A0AAV4T973_9ARAC|nr:hypothetical protein CDAR_236261 [Caerostris darwini]
MNRPGGMDDDPYMICPNKWPRGNGGRQICNYLTQIDMRELIFPRKRIGESVPVQHNIFPLSSICYIMLEITYAITWDSVFQNSTLRKPLLLRIPLNPTHPQHRLYSSSYWEPFSKNPNARPPVRIHNSLVNVISGDAFDGKNRLSATVHARGPGAPLAPFLARKRSLPRVPSSRSGSYR